MPIAPCKRVARRTRGRSAETCRRTILSLFSVVIAPCRWHGLPAGASGVGSCRGETRRPHHPFSFEKHTASQVSEARENGTVISASFKVCLTQNHLNVKRSLSVRMNDYILAGLFFFALLACHLGGSVSGLVYLCPATVGRVFNLGKDPHKTRSPPFSYTPLNPRRVNKSKETRGFSQYKRPAHSATS